MTRPPSHQALVFASVVKLIGIGLLAVILAAAYLFAAPRAQSANPDLTIHSNGFFAGGFPYTVIGEGFRPNTAVPLQIGEPGCCRFRTVQTDSAGGFQYTDITTSAGGQYQIRAYYRHDQTGRLREVASVTWTVLVR